MRRTRKFVIGLSVLALLPMALIMILALLAGLMGCEVGEGGSSRCMLAGADISGLLETLHALGSLELIAIPALMGVLLIWGFAEVISLLRRRRRLRRAARARG